MVHSRELVTEDEYKNEEGLTDMGYYTRQSADKYTAAER